MLSAVLRSPQAIQVSIEIARTVVRLRNMIAAHANLARKLAALKKKYDAQFRAVFDAIRDPMVPTPKSKRLIGFSRQEEPRVHLTRSLMVYPSLSANVGQ